MNTTSRTISSAILLLIGFNIGYLALLKKEIFWPMLILAFFLVIIGIAILFNKKEDEIEQIKNGGMIKQKEKRGKK